MKHVAILLECPHCRRRLSISSKRCQTKKGKGCGLNLDKIRDKTYYWLAYRLEGKLTWERFATLEDAQGWRNERVNQFTKGTLKTIEDLKPRAPEPKPQDTMTFGELSEWYLDLSQVKARRSFGAIQDRLNSFNEVFGNRILSSILTSEIQNYLIKRNQTAKASTVNQELIYSRHVVKMARLDRKVDENVILAFQGVRELESDAIEKDATITPEIFWKLHGAITERSKLPLEILGRMGMRENEVLSLNRDMIKLDKGCFEIPRSKAKEKKSKFIPIPAEIQAQLNDLGNREGNLFHLTKDQFIRDIRRASKEIGLPYGRFNPEGFTAHWLRHTFVTAGEELGISQKQVQALTGHRTTEMNEHYTHLKDKTLRDAMDTINRLLDGKIDPGRDEGSLLKELITKVGQLEKSVNRSVNKISDSETEIIPISVTYRN